MPDPLIAREAEAFPRYELGTAGKRSKSRARVWTAAAGMPVVFLVGAQHAGADRPSHIFEPTKSEAHLRQGDLSERLNDRLDALKLDGAEEGITVAEGAEKSLLSFIERFEVGRRPELTLRDDGSLRASFSCRHAELSILFTGDVEMQAALIATRASGIISKWAGFDDAEGIIDVLHGFKLADALLG